MRAPFQLRSTLLLLVGSLSIGSLLSGCDAGGGPPGTDANVRLMDGGGPPPGTDGGVLGVDAARADAAPAGSLAPGSACNCDSECEGTSANPGICMRGVCMTRAAGACASAGAAEGCPAGSRCWGLDGVTGGICWPDCASSSCAGMCDGDGSCVPSDTSTCDDSCSEICTGGDGGGMCPANAHLNMAGDGCVCDTGFVVSADAMSCVRECTPGGSECGAGMECVDNMCRTPPCTATSCPTGTMCAASGDCVIDIGTPPPGPPPTGCRVGSMGIPDWRCTSNCSELIAFDPRMGPGYDDYQINGEGASQYRSWLRRDVVMVVKYAAAMVACQAGAWPLGVGGAIGLGDMSEMDGSIPGTSMGSPGHPAGTHVDGHDMDLGYFQVGTADNRLRPICDHVTGGEDQYHCVSEPTNLDPWRTALFMAHLHVSPQLRVIGVDGRVGPYTDSATTQLCSDGWVSTSACTDSQVTYERTDTGRAWYRFHHHHFHISFTGG